MKIEGGVFSNSIEKKNNITVAEELMDTSEQPAGETREERQCGRLFMCLTMDCLGQRFNLYF